jgi:hypothetical protein
MLATTSVGDYLSNLVCTYRGTTKISFKKPFSGLAFKPVMLLFQVFQWIPVSSPIECFLDLKARTKSFIIHERLPVKSLDKSSSVTFSLSHCSKRPSTASPEIGRATIASVFEFMGIEPTYIVFHLPGLPSGDWYL